MAEAAVTPELQARDLVKRLGGRMVVDGVSLAVRGGELVGLLGPNGAGKTTIFRMLMGLLGSDGGQVLLAGRDVTRLAPHSRARLGLGYLPQHPSVFQGLTVEQNLQVALELCGSSQSCRPLLERFGLADAAKRRAAVLSGGERRRLELARLVAADPAVALLDEPLKGLDRSSVQEVGGLLRELCSRGRAILITDHAAPHTRALCDRTYVLEDGRLVEQTAAAMFQQGRGQPDPDGRMREWHSN